MSLGPEEIEQFEHSEIAEELVHILSTKTQNKSKLFFRVLVAYNFAKLASMMRVTVNTHARGSIPVNLYAINLAPSGAGKGHSTSIMEEQVINQFKDEFLEVVYPTIADKHLAQLAVERAKKKGTDDDVELGKCQLEFEKLGPLLFSFDSGTVPAVKQLRHQLLMANSGSMNLEIDEIGSNLLGSTEVLTAFLELFDIGKIKPKLVKNTQDKLRNEEIDGRTPTNMMLYGTPSKLLNGGKTEDEFFSFLETGYARRCLFGSSDNRTKDPDITAEKLYDMQTSHDVSDYLTDISDHLGTLADTQYFKLELTMSKEIILTMLDYQLYCESRADDMPEHEEIKRAEMTHRYFKAIKLAGAYAFVDGATEVEEEHLEAAIKLVEESGAAFDKIMSRDRPYVKLANYIVASEGALTQPDLEEDLAFYRGSQATRKQLEDLAIADGYRRGMIIRRSFHNSIQFLSGERLEKTSLDSLIVAYSYRVAEDYENAEITFEDMQDMVTTTGLQWTTHQMRDNYRDEDHAIAGFNCIVLDIDDGIPIGVAQSLFHDYTYIIHTTKSHSEDNPCYRMVLPISHVMKLEEEDFKEFMKNIFEWIPFELDEQVGQRSRKWGCHDGELYYNEAELLNVFPFIPNTAKNEEFKKEITRYSNLDNLERWFISNTGKGNRNSRLLRYGLILVDAGYDSIEIKDMVNELNLKLADRLSKEEIDNTVMITVNKKIRERDA